MVRIVNIETIWDFRGTMPNNMPIPNIILILTNLFKGETPWGERKHKVVLWASTISNTSISNAWKTEAWPGNQFKSLDAARATVKFHLDASNGWICKGQHFMVLQPRMDLNRGSTIYPYIQIITTNTKNTRKHNIQMNKNYTCTNKHRNTLPGSFW